MGHTQSIERSFDNIIDPCIATTAGDANMLAACVDARKKLMGVVADPTIDGFTPGTMAGTPAPEMVQAPASIEPIDGDTLLAPVVSGYMAEGAPISPDVLVRPIDTWILVVAIVALALIGLKSD